MKTIYRKSSVLIFTLLIMVFVEMLSGSVAISEPFGVIFGAEDTSMQLVGSIAYDIRTWEVTKSDISLKKFNKTGKLIKDYGKYIPENSKDNSIFEEKKFTYRSANQTRGLLGYRTQNLEGYIAKIYCSKNRQSMFQGSNQITIDEFDIVFDLDPQKKIQVSIQPQSLAWSEWQTDRKPSDQPDEQDKILEGANLCVELSLNPKNLTMDLSNISQNKPPIMVNVTAEELTKNTISKAVFKKFGSKMKVILDECKFIYKSSNESDIFKR